MSTSSLSRITMGGVALSAEAIAALAKSDLTPGQPRRALEEHVAKSEGGAGAWAVGCNSPGNALLMALLATIQPGEEVLVPAFGPALVPAMVVAAGGVPVFCDVDPYTYTLDVEEIEERCTTRTRACLPSHLFGLPADVDRLQLICRERGLRMIWDATQAAGATFDGRRLGGFPDLVVFSVGPTAAPLGGVVVGHDSGARTRVQRFANLGASQPDEHLGPGFDAGISDLAAAAALAHAQGLEGRVLCRRMFARRYDELLPEMRALRTPLTPDELRDREAAQHRYTVVLDTERLRIDRETFVARLAEERIASEIRYPLPLTQQPAFASYGRDAAPTNAIELARRVISLPLHAGMEEADVERTARTVREIHDGALR